ncbi:septal ring lytic transglycosylase RlpA family protein [Actinomadura sp. 7K507]|nr:septal ring lytic transglycosylase RlpA family protein [Actinomadura sp. 7K507]
MPKPESKKKKRKKAVASGSCEASYYWQGQMTASGEKFDPSELTAAHKTLPMGSKVRVTNKSNDRSVTVRINDRGPFVSGRCLDLSRAAMKKVGGTGSGVIQVRYEVLSRG